MAQGTEQGVRIGLSVVVMTLKDRQAVVLTTPAEHGVRALPFGPFDPARDRTFERALRDYVTQQTGFRLGFVEQLYTFGDAGRASPRATPGPDQLREVSVGYLALTRDAAGEQTHDSRWDAVFDFFPWEDRRASAAALSADVVARLLDWAGADSLRLARARALFALTPSFSTKRVWSPRPSATETRRRPPTFRARSWPLTTGAFWPPRWGACAAS